MYPRCQASTSSPAKMSTIGAALMSTTPLTTTRRRCSLTSLAAGRTPEVARVPVAWVATTSRRKRRTRANRAARTLVSRCNSRSPRMLTSPRRSTMISSVSLSARSPKARPHLRCKYRQAFGLVVSHGFYFFLIQGTQR